jgi:hypothetical protein
MLSFNTYISLSFSQISADSITIHSDFDLIEFGETQGEMINVSSIEYSFPPGSGEIGGMELNFTEIRYDREIFVIEDIPVVTKQLKKDIAKGYAVQINITEPTEIYSVHIYGVKIKNATTTTITVQINGYDSISEQPNNTNNTIFASTSLNMTNQIGWYIHHFSSPVLLPKGDFYLVLNGTEMAPQEKVDLYWGLNNLNPYNPNLYIWKHDGTNWIENATGEPFLYKLDQRVLSEFYPSDINLTAEIDDINYPILNGIDIGTGILSINSTVPLPDSNITIPIVSNKSFGLIFNVSFRFQLHNHLTTQGSAVISESIENQWTIIPTLQRKFNNYSVEFNYPNSWQNLSVFRKLGPSWVDIQSEIIIDEINKKIYLPNSTILDGAEWRFTATSPQIAFTLNFPFKDWYLGQELLFSVYSPINSGNLTFVLINPGGFIEHSEVKVVSTEETEFSYILPLSSREGSYTAKIYWNNQTDAGVQTEKDLHITKQPVQPNILISVLTISLIIIGITAVSGTSYLAIRNYRRKILEKQERIYTNCMDILNLDYFMVTDKNSGLNVYTQNFSGKEVDAALISGFLQAIHSFGIELIKVEDRSQTIKLEYQDSIVLMTEFVNLRLILLMRESPSRTFLFSLEDLAYDIFKNYGDKVDSFDGDINPFKGIELK